MSFGFFWTSWTVISTLAFAGVMADETSIDKIVDFTPSHPVHDVMNIAQDLRAIGREMSTGTMNFDGAYQIYSQGGYSDSVAKLKLLQGLPFFLDQGTRVTGTGTAGRPITGFAKKSYEIGEREIEILYSQAQDDKCYVGGLVKPDETGCFLTSGQLSVDGHDGAVGYLYSVNNDNYNLRTLQKLSAEAKDEFTLPNGKFTEDFPFFKFEEYYGTPDYADQLLHAVFRHESWRTAKHSFDFSSWTDEDRAWFLEHGTDYMNIAQHILGRLEKVNLACVDNKDCTDSDTCNLEATYHLDEAVAFYTGSFWDEGDEGNMLYGLADRMCKLFKTCGWSYNTTDGTSHVNLLNFQKFHSIQKALKNGNCHNVHVDTEVVSKMVMIPLWQGFLQAVHSKKRHEATTFAIATLPILAHCSEEAEYLFDYYLPSTEREYHFPHTKLLLERHYKCMNLDCETMGGLWLAHKNRYHGHAEPCVPGEVDVTDEESGGNGGLVVVALLVITAILVAVGIVLKRRRRWQQAAAKAAEDAAWEEEDNYAVGEQRGEII